MEHWINAHRYAIWVFGEGFMLSAGAFAIWSIARDLRAAWPRIREMIEQARD